MANEFSASGFVIPGQGINMYNGFNASLGNPNHPVTSLTNPPRLQMASYSDSMRYNTHYQYPHAFKDQYLDLGTYITGLAAEGRDDQSFLLTRILPLKLTNAMKVRWNRIHFPDGAAQILAEEGVPHVLKFTQTSGEETVQRFGIAFKGESNYMYTAEGQALMSLQIVQTLKACEEAQCIDTIFTRR